MDLLDANILSGAFRPDDPDHDPLRRGRLISPAIFNLLAALRAE